MGNWFSPGQPALGGGGGQGGGGRILGSQTIQRADAQDSSDPAENVMAFV